MSTTDRRVTPEASVDGPGPQSRTTTVRAVAPFAGVGALILVLLALLGLGDDPDDPVATPEELSEPTLAEPDAAGPAVGTPLDGDWTSQGLSSPARLFAVAASGERELVAVGGGHGRGVTWRINRVGVWEWVSTMPGVDLVDVAAEGDRVVALGREGTQALVLTSDRGGRSWTPIALPGEEVEPAAVARLDGGFVVVGFEADRAAAWWVDADRLRPMQVDQPGIDSAILAVEGRWAVGRHGSDPAVWRLDGGAWRWIEARFDSLRTEGLGDIAVMGEELRAVGGSGTTLWASDEGMSWELRGGTGGILDAAALPQGFVLVRFDGTLQPRLWMADGEGALRREVAGLPLPGTGSVIREAVGTGAVIREVAGTPDRTVAVGWDGTGRSRVWVREAP